MTEKILGIGGVFFRAKDPKALADWYEAHFGIDKVPMDYDTPAWQQKAGTTVFAPFAEDTDYFGNPEKQWMLNFRVRDLDKMMAQLTEAGIEVSLFGDAAPNGRFAHLKDPEGNPIELWEPNPKES